MFMFEIFDVLNFNDFQSLRYVMFEYVMGGHLYLSALHCAECMQYDMAVNEGTDILSL